MSDLKFWEECISESLDEQGISATKEQLTAIAKDMSLAHENYGMAFYQPESPYPDELAKAKKELATELSKVFCRTCNGSGRYVTDGPYHSSSSTCDKCHGEGKHLP